MNANQKQTVVKFLQKQTVVKFLREDIGGCIQQPPCIRTVFFGDGPIRLSFPWISFGNSRQSEDCIVAFFHIRQWYNLEDAVDVFYLLPQCFHRITGFGDICIGDDAGWQVFTNKITPQQAFWMTDNIDHRIRDVPQCMLDIVNPEKVLIEGPKYWSLPDLGAWNAWIERD